MIPQHATFIACGDLNEKAPTGSFVQMLDPQLVELFRKDYRRGLPRGGGVSPWSSSEALE